MSVKSREINMDLVEAISETNDKERQRSLMMLSEQVQR